MEERQPSAAEARVQGFFSVVALAVVGLAAVSIAMVTLGSTVADSTPTPLASASATPTPEPSTPPPLPTDTPAPVMTVPVPRSAPTITTVYSGAHDPHGVWTIAWRYPQLKAGTTTLAAAINADILDEVQTRMDAFMSGPAGLEQAPGKVNTLTGSYTVNMNSPDLLSLTLRWTEDTLPVNESVHLQTLNYALISGQRLSLSGLFRDQQAGMNVISTESRTQLQRILGGDYDPKIAEPGTAAVASNFNNWALTTAGLRITFDEYQVGTYADGMPAVVIPWEMIADVMDPNSPAGRLAGLTPIPTPTPPPGWTPTPEPTPAPTDTPESTDFLLPLDSPSPS
jgi:hypothetical protein